ncbi:hypothetical protein JCM3774_004127 [Rhodotorula dairenensis]
MSVSTIASPSAVYQPRQAPAVSAAAMSSSQPPTNGSEPLYTTEYLPPFAPRHWTVLKEVGDGSFGTVWLADWHSPLYIPPGTRPPGPSSRPEYRGRRLVAIKRMKKAFDGGWDECMKLKELKSLRQIPMHPNVIPLYDAFLLPTSRELYFVFECMEGNLYQLTKSRRGRPIAAALFASIFFQILAGLAHVHDHGYFHRDLKPENLLITTTGLTDYPSSRINAPPNAPKEKDVIVVVKLADFGLAREIMSTPPYTEYVSTRWYRAPEVLLRSRDYSAPVDLWALGCILLEVLTLKPLFPGDSEVDQVFKICEILGDPANDYGTEEDGNPRGGGVWRRGVKMAARVGFSFPTIPPRPFATLFDRSTMTPLLMDSIHRMLRYDPAARISAKDLLGHAFFEETARRFGPNIAVNLPPGQDPYGPPPAPSPTARAQPPPVVPNGVANRSVSTLDLALRQPTSDVSDRSLPPSHSIPHDRQPAPPFAQPPVAVASHSRAAAVPQLAVPGQTNGKAAVSNAVPPTLAQRPLDQQSIRSMPESLYNGSQLNGRNGLDARSLTGGPLQRVSTYASSVAPSTYYDGSVFEGAGPARASSILSFPLQYNGMEAMPPLAGPSGFNTYRSQSPAPSSIYSQTGVQGRASSSNPLKRAPSDASLSSMRINTPPGTHKSDEFNEASERDLFVDPAEAIGGTAKERARAVLLKKTTLRGAADPLHNFTVKKSEDGSDSTSIFSHSGRSFGSDAKGKGRAAPSERMPQIIEDTGRLHVSSPPHDRSAATSSGGFNRHKTRRREGNDDVHSLMSVESGRSAPAGTFSIPGGKGRTFSISSKATSASDPERRQNPSSEFLGLSEPPARLQSVSSLPIPGVRRAAPTSGSMQRLPSLGQYTAPSTGHSSLDAALIGRMQGLASSSQQDLPWPNEPARARNDAGSSPRLDRSGSRSRVASPSETRFSPYSATSRQPLPTLPPIQSFDAPPTSQHPILQRQGTGAASIASFRSTPGVMPSYFAAPDRARGRSRDAGPAGASTNTYHLPYLPVMDAEPSTAGPPPPPPVPLSAGLASSSFPFKQQAPSLAAITEPPTQALTPEHLPPG